MGRAARNPETGLTDKEERFSELVAFNPELSDTDAYKQVYNCSRMKETTIGSRAYDLKKLPHVAQHIIKLREERSERTKIDADWLLQRLAAEAEADVGDLYYKEGGIKPVHEWPKVWRQGLVAGLDVEQQYMYDEGEKTPDGIIAKIKLSDRVKRLEMIGKHISVQAFKEKVEVTVDDTLAEKLAAKRKERRGSES